MGWHSDLVDKLRTQTFDGAPGGQIIRIARNRDGLINGADKWRNGAARLQRVTMASKRLRNLKSNMAGTNANVLGVSDAKIDVSDIRASDKDAKVKIRDESARRFARHNSTELQRDFARRQRLRRDWQRLSCE